MEFKDRLKAVIVKAGMTQREAAARLGCSENQISHYLRGMEPRLSTYERMVAVFPELREPIAS